MLLLCQAAGALAAAAASAHCRKPSWRGACEWLCHASSTKPFLPMLQESEYTTDGRDSHPSPGGTSHQSDVSPHHNTAGQQQTQLALDAIPEVLAEAHLSVILSCAQRSLSQSASCCTAHHAVTRNRQGLHSSC